MNIFVGFFCKDERNLPPAIVPKGDDELLDSLGVTRHDDVSDDEWKHVGFATEARLLFKREIIHNSRNKKGVGARFALTTFMSILVGNIFFGVGGTSSYTDPSVSRDVTPCSLLLIQFLMSTCPIIVWIK